MIPTVADKAIQLTKTAVHSLKSLLISDPDKLLIGSLIIFSPVTPDGQG